MQRLPGCSSKHKLHLQRAPEPAMHLQYRRRLVGGPSCMAAAKHMAKTGALAMLISHCQRIFLQSELQRCAALHQIGQDTSTSSNKRFNSIGETVNPSDLASTSRGLSCESSRTVQSWLPSTKQRAGGFTAPLTFPNQSGSHLLLRPSLFRQSSIEFFRALAGLVNHKQARLRTTSQR